MALASVFAACTNEEIIGVDVPEISTEVARPTVSGVTLDFNGVESRMSFSGGKFNWVDGDKVAVMLMDQNNTGVRYGSSTLTDEWEALTWLERYHLVDYVHTNYPFVLKDGEWVTDANMLEGNYFLVYPAAEFDGKRQAYFDISKQEQFGNTQQARMDAYAKNQRFVGYARLDAAAGSSSLKTQMSEVLAPIRIDIESRLSSVKGEPLKINKIVLTHPLFHSQFAIDPTTADYGNWNLTAEYSVGGDNKHQELPGDNNDVVNNWSYDQFFNYANYLTATGIADSKKELYMHGLEGSMAAEDYVFNATKIGDVAVAWNPVDSKNGRKADTYYYDEAMRAVVKPLWKENWSENVTKYIEVYTYAADGKDAYTLEKGYDNKLGVIAMVPPFANRENYEDQEGKQDALELYIYTNKGLVGPIDLSEALEGNESSGVQSTEGITAADPRMGMKDVTIVIDDDDVKVTPRSPIINNTDDLKNYVAYYTKYPTDDQVTVQLTNDVIIDDDLAEAIKTMKADKGINNIYLEITTAEGVSKNANIRLDVQENADIMEFMEISDEVLVQIVDGAVVDLTPKAGNYANPESNLNILIDKGGVLNYVEDNTAVGGWNDYRNFAAEHLNTIVTNNGTLNIKADLGDNAGLYLVNNAEVNVEEGAEIHFVALEGTNATASENRLNGVINVAEGAELSGTSEYPFKNRGTIVTKGKIKEVLNADAENNVWRIVPGRIHIASENAQTKLRRNRGQVIYDVLPVVPVEVKNEAYATEGMYIYKTDVDVTAAQLIAHHVTDAVINGATLSIGGYLKTNEETNLRHLTLNNGSKLVSVAYKTYKTPSNVIYTIYLQCELKFNSETSDGRAWDNDYSKKNQFITNGNVEVSYVNVNLNNTEYEAIFNEGEVSMLKNVTFTTDGSAVADILLNAVDLKVCDGFKWVYDTQFGATEAHETTVGAIESLNPGVTSDIDVETNSDLVYTSKGGDITLAK